MWRGTRMIATFYINDQKSIINFQTVQEENNQFTIINFQMKEK